MSGNIAPAEMALISTPWRSESDSVSFQREYLRVLPLLHFNYSAINPVAVKSLMRVCGLPVGSLRRPLRDLEGALLESGVRVVRELGLDRKYGYRLGA